MELAPDITEEDIKVFLDEAEENLSLLDEDIVRLEREQNSLDLLQEIFRAAHTLKGSSAMLGYHEMTQLAHAMESVLDMVRKGTLEVSTRVVDALLHSHDVLVMLKEELATPLDRDVDIRPTVAELESVMEGGLGRQQTDLGEASESRLSLDRQAMQRLHALAEAGHDAYRLRVTFSSETNWPAVRCLQVVNELDEIGEVLASDPSRAEIEEERVGLVLQVVFAGDQDEGTLASAVASVDEIHSVEVSPYDDEDTPTSTGPQVPVDDDASRRGSQRPQGIRIDVDRMDQLMNTVGELVIDRTRISQISNVLESRYGEDEMVQALSRTSAHIVRIVDELQESTMKIRMLPVGTVFSGFARMVRDLAQAADKRLDFMITGQDTEIDRTVIERIRDPLVHLLRNAVDHAIEPPEQRRDAGKPETAVIQLSAYHEQAHIVTTVEDDGRGIDPQRVRDSALKKGLISEERASRLSDAESVDLIFMAGMSTAQTTTEVSGRRVGLDIVRSNTEAINGFVNVDTRIGEGTRFTLKLPLTLATVEALLVSSNETLYAVPAVYVQATVDLKPEDIQTIQGRAVFGLRENVVPLFELGAALGMDTAGTPDRDKTSVVVVRFGERLVGLAVDYLLELQEIVVKSLGGYIGEVAGMAGASILGDGRVVLIVDVATVMNSGLLRGTQGVGTSTGGLVEVLQHDE